MGNIIKNWAKTQKCGKGEVKAILLCLADAAKDYERGRVEMTVPQIADVTEFAERSIYRWLDILEGESLKLITRDKSKKADGTNNPNVYKIQCPPEIFIPKEHSDCQTPSETDILTVSQYEQGDYQTPSTVLEEEESLITKTHINALAREVHVYPLKELYEAFPDLELTPAQIGFIESDVKKADKAAWLATIKIYQQNNDQRRNRYMPEKVGNLLSVFNKQKIEVEKKNGSNQPNNPKRESDAARKQREAGERKQVFDSVDDILAERDRQLLQDESRAHRS